MGRILVGGDDGAVTSSLAVLLRADGMVVQEARLPDSIVQGVEADLCDLVIVHLGIEKGSGLDLVSRCVEADPDIPVLAVADECTVDEALSACEKGAVDYITTPINPKKFTQTMHRWLDQEGQGNNSQSSVVRLQHEFRLSRIIAESPSMIALCDRVLRLGPAEVPLTILGSPGSGRRAVAEALHEASSRKNEILHVYNCLEDSEESLFGASDIKKKKLRGENSLVLRASGSTMYLYNTEKLSKTAQKKILKVINDREILVEGEASVPADLRFLFSFGLPLIEIMKQDTMLPEFIQRVSVLSIQMPELNDRRQDILPLISYLLSEANGGKNSLEYAVSSVGAEMLERYDWPGGGLNYLNLLRKNS